MKKSCRRCYFKIFVVILLQALPCFSRPRGSPSSYQGGSARHGEPVTTVNNVQTITRLKEPVPSEVQSQQAEIKSKGREIRYIASRQGNSSSSHVDLVCQEDMVPCSDSRGCYLLTGKCDGLIQCNDASDELQCSCFERMYSAGKHCDSYPDCPDFSDERGCDGCSPGELSCKENGTITCVPESAVCDGRSDCADNSDEKLCSRLSQWQVHTSPLLTLLNEGYMEVKRDGSWLPLCADLETNYAEVVMDHCDQVVGSRHAVDDQSFQPLTGTEPIMWVHYNDTSKLFSVSSQCSQNLLLYVKCSVPTCGNQSVERKRRKINTNEDSVEDVGSYRSLDRIVGGREAEANVWSFIVGILSDGIYHCGGTILTSEWILTVSHCFSDFYLQRNFEVQAGMYRRGSWSPFEQTSAVSRVIRHPEFNSLLQNDVALVKLETPLYLNRWVRPVCLARDIHPEEDDYCTVAGWGTQIEGEIQSKSDTMMEVDVPILDSCLNSFPGYSDESLICAGYKEGMKDACAGDSGGPLMCYGDTEGWVQAGIVSFGRGCARPNEPGSYSRVTFFYSWIIETLGRIEDNENLPAIDLQTKCLGSFCQLPAGKCLHAKLVCDREVNCLDAVDELYCNPEVPATPSIDSLDTSPTITTADYIASDVNTQNTASAGADSTASDAAGADSTASDVAGADSTAANNTAANNTAANNTAANNTAATSNYTVYGGYNNQFSISNAAVPPTAPECSYTEFVCEKLPQCVPMSNICDGVKDCADGTDEVPCDSLDRLLQYNSSWHCDGYHDCFDLRDENCPPPIVCQGMYVCHLSRECVPHDKVCDSNIDCVFAEDEMECLTLLKEPGTLVLNKFMQPEHRSNGTLAYRGTTEWRPVCLEEIPDHMLSEICEYLGYREVKMWDSIIGPTELNVVMPSEPEYSTQNAGKSRFLLNAETSFNMDTFTRVARRVSNEPLAQDTKRIAFMAELQALENGRKRQRVKREENATCPQVEIVCQTEPCGKIHRYFLSEYQPLHELGGVPWAGTVFVNGGLWCGSTLVHPYWVITSKACMDYDGEGLPDLALEYVSVVMGSWREVGETRLWGAHEHDRRVDFMKAVENTDILLLHLEKRMPKTLYISHLCLPNTVVDNMAVNKTCTIAGYSPNEYRTTRGVELESGSNCGNGSVCFLEKTGETPCMRSWSGVIACKFGRPSNPTWAGVGMWNYKPPNGSCVETTTHSMFTEEELFGIRSVQAQYSPQTLATCQGRMCPTGICISSDDHCDGFLTCPDLSDEPLTCPPQLSACRLSSEESTCVCDDGGLPCQDGVCIPRSRVCDGLADCVNGTDEISCTCARLLWRDSPGKLCDGNIDCDDQEDESVCGCTPMTEFFRCYKSTAQGCIPRVSVCDGIIDCSEGEDEAACVALAPEIPVEEDALGLLPIRMEGFFLVRVRGRWFTFQLEKWNINASPLLCAKLGFRHEATESRDYENLLKGVVYIICSVEEIE